MRWVPLFVPLVAACGRIGFDPTAPDGAGSGAVRTCADVANALVCDDFEAGLGTWTGVPSSITVVDAPAHSGSHAIQITIDQGGTAAMYVEPTAMAAATTLDTRAWFYVPSSAQISHANMLTIQNAVDQITVWASAGELNLFAQLGASQHGQPGQVAIPRDRWFCAELDLTIAASGSATQRIDGATSGAFDPLDTRTPGGYTQLLIGVGFSLPDQPPLTFYMDDVAMGTVPPGC